jgi:hypothetical protein
VQGDVLMMQNFYRLFFQLTGDDRLAFEALSSDAEAVEAAVAASADLWRHRMRALCGNQLACRHSFAMRALLTAATLGVRGSRGPRVAAAFALFLTDLVEQRVRTLDLEENQDGADTPGMLPAGTFVEVWKASASARPMVEPSEWQSWVSGRPDKVGALPVGYAMRGVLLKPLQTGTPIRLLRIQHNGTKAIGEFRSSNVVALRPGHLVETTSSIYIVRPTDMGSVQIGEES